MIGELTLYATLRPQPVDSQVEQKISESYLFNSDCIIDLVDETSFRRLRYKFHPYEDRSPVFVIDVTNTAAALKTLSDATPASTKITLNVFEDAQTFDIVSSLTAVAWNFNVKDIVWGENDPTDAYARIWVMTGGNKVTAYIVDHNISQIVDVADTGTTTAG
jgi:hypothetical protein